MSRVIPAAWTECIRQLQQMVDQESAQNGSMLTKAVEDRTTACLLKLAATTDAWSHSAWKKVVQQDKVCMHVC